VKVRVHEMELVTLSPVAVTAGRDAVLSPYTDFVQDGDSLIYLDPRKLEAALGRASPSVLDEFVRGVRSQMGWGRSGFDLRSFLRDRLGLTPESLALRRVSVHGQIRHRQVRRLVTDAGRPFIPGSTIKGALRTAIFYFWLRETPEGEALLTRLVGLVGQVWSAEHANLERAEGHFRDGRKRDGYQIADGIRRRASDAFRILDENEVFGMLNDRRVGAEMRYLRVSDSALLDPGKIFIAGIERLKLRGRETEQGTPQWSEAIPAGARLPFRVSIEPRFTRESLRFMNDDSLVSLLERVHTFACDTLEWEKDVLAAVSGNLYSAIRSAYGRWTDQEYFEDTALVRLGGGKTYMENSVGLVLRDHDPEVFQRFRKLLGLGRNPKFGQFSGSEFPATRSYVCRNGTVVEPLGWVRLRKIG
jgi:CRISPR-associated protein Csm5